MAVPQGDQICVELDPNEVLAVHARHRRRLAASMALLDASELAAQSRCSEWSVADVLRHLADVDGWMQAIWTGGRPPFTSFDPNTTPHEFVVAGRSISDEESRDRFLDSSEVLAADVGAAGPERWGLPAVSPVGFVPWWLSALHVFYDSWLHERDVLLPLGLRPPVESDEAIPVLAYSLALTGTLIREPFVADVAGVRLVTGDGPSTATPLVLHNGETDVAGVIDSLSGRGKSLEDELPAIDPDVTKRLGGLARFLGSSTTAPAGPRSPDG